MLLVDDKDKSKSGYDKRSHDQRIADLKTAFIELCAKAQLTGKKTDASQAKILIKAKVHKSYLHKGKKPKVKDEATQQRYFDVHDDIVEFQENFNKLPPKDTLLNKVEAAKKKEENRAIKAEKQLVDSRQQVAGLYQKIAQLQERSRKNDHSLIELNHQALMADKQSPSNVVNFVNAAYVSPDQYLRRDGIYCFDDEALKKDAWERSEKDLHEALARNLPMRVYMLIGPACAGKSYWAKNTKTYWNDRHPVVIDATNLSIFQRMKWFNIINQYIRTNDIHVCAVVFETPLDVLFARNNINEPGKKMPDQVIKDKFNALVWPDLKEEKFNEIVVVRHG
tara:strand:+ start:667 stop:1677 length:1011 start_codon:yes stop_codon:yes gene_type:complete